MTDAENPVDAIPETVPVEAAPEPSPNDVTVPLMPPVLAVQIKESFWQLVREGKELEAWELLESEIKALL